MRRFPSTGAGRVPAKLLLALTLLASLGGCTPDAPLGPFGVRQVAIVLLSDTARPGELVKATAFPLNGRGEIVDAPVTWQSLTPAMLTVDAGGVIRGLAPGVGVVRAAVGSITADRSVQLVNPPAAQFTTSVDSLTVVLPGGTAQVSATALDVDGAELVGAPLSWASDAPRIATVSSLGVITPVAVGRAVIRVSLDGVSRDVPVRVAPAPSATAPTITSVTPALIAPGVVFTVRGSQLKPAGNNVSVAVDGRVAQLLSSTDTELTAVLNEASLPCLPSADVAVQVSTAGGVGAIGARLQLAAQRAPVLGEALLLMGSNDPRCVELPGEGRYLVSVVNTARAMGAGALQVSLGARAGLGDPIAITMPPAQPSSAKQNAHLELLEASARAVSSSRQASHAATLESDQLRLGAGASAAVQVAPVGELTALRVPDLDAGNICTNFRPIHARTVYAGSRVFIVEDTTTHFGASSLLAGSMDAELQQIGAEIDNLLWPIITRFGNPLVMDSRLDDNNRIVVTLTPALNEMRGGAVLGAVVTCDFYPRAQFAASNVGEMLYLQVPTLTGETDAATALARWRHAVRGTIAHELKHVVSFGEHIVRNLPLEEMWLEEATAQHAEELFTRAITGASATGNTGYASIRCEVLAAQGDGSCAGTPALMRPTFDALWDFLSVPASRSPLGPTSGSDFSFYGSGWSLLRWAMDHAVTAEATFTQQLTVSSQSGVANLEARAGRSWEEMLGRWSLALATDGRSGIAPSDLSLRFPSWDIGGIFAGLCNDLGPCNGGIPSASRYTRAHPVQPFAPPADFELSVPELAPAGFLLVEVSASGLGTRRFIRLSGANGAPPPAAARLAILRIN